MSEETEMPLATVPALTEGEIKLTPKGSELIANTLAASGMVGRVSNPGENDTSVTFQLDIKRILKDMADLQAELTKPVLERHRAILAFFKATEQQLREELDRLSKLSGDFIQLEEAKQRAAEHARNEELSKIERERQAALAKATTHEELEATQAHFNARAAVEVPPPPPLVVAKGQSAKPDWEIEVTDVHLFARTFPSCVKIEPRLTEIKALLRAGTTMTEKQGIRVKLILAVNTKLPPTKAAIDV